MAATPERIELEAGPGAGPWAEPEEVSEETLTRYNLSGEPETRRSSESVKVWEEIEEEEEEEEEEEGEGAAQHVTAEATAASRGAMVLPTDDEEEDEEGDEEEEDENEEESEAEEESESSDEGEYRPWEEERRSRLLPLEEGEESGEEESCPPVSDTPVESDSASLHRGSVTPPTAATPSTASFITPPGSALELELAGEPLSPVVVAETPAAEAAGRGRGLFDDITPELPQKVSGDQEEEEEEADPSAGVKNRRKRNRGARSLPPRLLPPHLQAGGGALLLHLKGLREAPPPGQVDLGGGGARALWKAVFPGNKKEQKKKIRTLPAETKMKTKRRTAGEESDLDSTTLLQRCSLDPRNNLKLDLLGLVSEIQKVTVEEEEEEEDQEAYVPHALAFKRSYGIKRQRLRDGVRVSGGRSVSSTEVVGVLVAPREPSSLSTRDSMFQTGPEDQDPDLDPDRDLDARITRRVQRAARRQAKHEQLKRLHKAQMIQRQLQQVEEKQRQLEEQGVLVEKALRGEADYWDDSGDSPDVELHLGGLGRLDNPALMQQWFQLVQQKNSLVRYESELMIFARELELEDRQSRLQQELRERMAVDDHLKDEEQLAEERLILEEMLEVVEQRNALVSLLEEQRLQERQEDQDLEQVVMAAGLGLSWA